AWNSTGERSTAAGLCRPSACGTDEASGNRRCLHGKSIDRCLLRRWKMERNRCGGLSKRSRSPLGDTKSRKVRWSQWVDATLAQSLLVGVYEADFVRARRFKRNKALFRF